MEAEDDRCLTSMSSCFACFMVFLMQVCLGILFWFKVMVFCVSDIVFRSFFLGAWGWFAGLAQDTDDVWTPFL